MNRILRIKDVIDTIGLSRSTIYAMLEREEFPRPVKLGARAIGWPRESIEEWMKRLPKA